MRQLSQLFLDTRCLTTELTQVVQLGLANIAATLQLDRFDLAAKRLEGTLHTNAVGYLTDSERRVQTAVATTDDHALERLQTLTLTFNNLHLNYDRIAGAEFRDFLGHLFSFNFSDNVALVAHRSLLKP